MQSLIRMFRFVSPYKWRLFFFAFTAVGFSMMNSLPLLIIRQFFDYLIAAEALGPSEVQAFKTWTLVLFSTIVLRAYFAARRELAEKYLAQVAVRDATDRVIAHILARPLAFYDRWRSGDLISRISSDSAAFTRTVQMFTAFVREPLSMVAIFGTLVFINWQLALIGTLGLILAFWPAVVLSAKIRRASGRARELAADRSDSMVQVFGGMRVVKGFSREDLVVERFAKNNSGIFSQMIRAARAHANLRGMLELIGGLGLVVVFVVGFQMVRSDITTASELVTFVAGLGLMSQPVRALGNANSMVQESLPAAERLFALLDVDDSLEHAKIPVAMVEPRDAIRLDSVRFSYGRETVLDKIDIEIRIGKVTAIVGPSGSGKSTILNLVARFYDPTDGIVSVDGTDLRKIEIGHWLGRLGLVTQDPYLFNISIRDNIRFGRLDATDADIEGAARLAGIHEEIVALDNGYETSAGERGGQLSGGQRQRICLARALVRDPTILLLDEATSSLDSASERVVQEAIERAQAGRTSLVVAHRLSTVMSADTIYVMSDGRIEAAGTHDELLTKSATYERLWKIQQGERVVNA